MVTPKPSERERRQTHKDGQPSISGGYRTRRIPWGWIVVIAVVALIAGNLVASKLTAAKPLPEGLIQANGRIEGDHVIVSSKFAGRLELLAAREGDTVAKGQLLLKVSDPQTDAHRMQLAAQLAAAIAQEQSASETVSLTRQTGAAQVIQAQGQVDQATSGIQTTRSDLVRAAAAVASAKAAQGVANENVKIAESALAAARANRRRAFATEAEYAANLASAREEFAAATASVGSAQAASDLANRQAQRYSGLESEGAISNELAEQMRSDALQKQGALAGAQHQAKSAEAKVVATSTELEAAKEGIQVVNEAVVQAEAELGASKQQALSAQLAVTQAQAQQIEARAAVRQNEAKRNQAVGQLKQALSAPTQIRVSQGNRDSAKAQIKAARGALAEVDSILREMSVQSPTNGTVVTRFQEQGEMVSPGGPILELVDLDKLYLKVYIPEEMVGKVRLGLPAQIYTDAYPKQAFPAKVGYIASEAEFTPKDIQTQSERVSLMYEVRLYLDSNPGHRLSPGLPADAIIKWKDGVPWMRPQ